MTEQENATKAKPCEWCLGKFPHKMACECRSDCGENECAMADRPYGEVPQIPLFGVDGLPAPGLVLGDHSDADQAIIDEAELALYRVLKLHKRCPCTSCQRNDDRAVCTGCQEHVPCRTVRAINDELPE